MTDNTQDCVFSFLELSFVLYFKMVFRFKALKGIYEIQWNGDPCQYHSEVLQTLLLPTAAN